MLGNYRLLSRLATGGMAEVFLARQEGALGFAKTVAIKAVLPHVANERRFIEMLFDEARIGAQISHRRVVQTYGFGEDQGRYFIVMEHVAGQSLSELMGARARRKAHFDVHTAARIVADVAAGLHSAHELRDASGAFLGVIHRDVTPGNVVVSYDGEVKVIDFGIAKATNRLTRTMTGNLKGKIAYMSPEQIRDDPLDRRSDIFSLGVVLWELLTLRRLFRRKNEAATLQAILSAPADPPSKYRAIPRELDSIARRALAINPDDRFQTALEMQRALQKVIGDTPIAQRKRSQRRLLALLQDWRAEGAETKCIDIGAEKRVAEPEKPATSNVLKFPLPEPFSILANVALLFEQPPTQPPAALLDRAGDGGEAQALRLVRDREFASFAHTERDRFATLDLRFGPTGWDVHPRTDRAQLGGLGLSGWGCDKEPCGDDGGAEAQGAS